MMLKLGMEMVIEGKLRYYYGDEGKKYEVKK